MTSKRLRAVHFALLLLSMGACDGGGCSASDSPTPGAADGTVGGRCPCTTTYTTCKRGVCRSCGGDGEAACPTYSPISGTYPCKPPLVWEEGTNRCVSTCGKVGQPCCKAAGYGYSCASGVSCNTTTLKCEAKAPLCADGPKTMTVACQYANGCALSVVRGYASSATYDEAKSCVQSSFTCASVSDKPVTSYAFCVHYPTKVDSTLEVNALDDVNAKKCAEATAGSKSDGTPISVTAGACVSS